MSNPASRHDRGPLVRLVDDAKVPPALFRAFPAEREGEERARNLARTIASSRPTWQAVVRADQLFATFQRIDGRTRALVCTFVSILNESEYCIDDCASSALNAGIERDELLQLASSSILKFDHALTTTLRYAYFVVVSPNEIPPAVLQQLRTFADDELVLELTTMVAMKCFWNHFVSALGVPSEGRCIDEEVIASLLAVAQSKTHFARDAEFRGA